MIWLKRLWARLTGGQVVWLRDHDHEVCTRIARNTPFGLMAWRHGLGVQQVFLLPDGKTRGCCYVVAWKPDEYAAGTPGSES